MTDIFYKGNIVVWLFGSDYSVYEVVKDYEEMYILSDLVGNQIKVNPRVVKNGGYKDADDDLFLWFWEIFDFADNEIKIYPKKLNYNQITEEAKEKNIKVLRALHSLGYTLNGNKEDYKHYFYVN